MTWPAGAKGESLDAALRDALAAKGLGGLEGLDACGPDCAAAKGLAEVLRRCDVREANNPFVEPGVREVPTWIAVSDVRNAAKGPPPHFPTHEGDPACDAPSSG